MEDKKEDENFQQQITQLREWLEQKVYVPKNVEEKLYRRFLHSCYYELDKAKTASDLFFSFCFSFRSTTPELLTNRDPLSPDMQKTLRITNIAWYRISGNRNLWIWQLNDPGLRQYDNFLEAKMTIVATDSWILDDDFLEEEDIVVSDVKDLSLRMLTKFSYSVTKKVSKYQQEALPMRMKQIHIINAPRIIYRVFSALKPFLGKMMEMMHIHPPKSTTLYDFVSRDDLPEDFGGTRGKLSDFVAETTASILRNREYLIDDNFWRCDLNASKAKVDKRVDAASEISSLRTLSID